MINIRLNQNLLLRGLYEELYFHIRGIKIHMAPKNPFPLRDHSTRSQRKVGGFGSNPLEWLLPKNWNILVECVT